MYNVLNIFKKLEPTQEQQVKAEAQSIYESVEAKGSILEGVKGVEEKLNEKYMGFKKVAGAAKAGGAENPEAVAASIGRKKYGKKAFQKAAASGKKMHEGQVDQNNDGKHDFEDVKVARMKAALKGKKKDDSQVDEMFSFDTKSKDRGPRDTGRGDELGRRAKLGKNPLAKGNPYGSEYKNKGKYGDMYNIAGPKGVLPEGEREENATIPGTDKKAKSRYNPTNKPAPVKKLDKPTDKFDKIKNEGSVERTPTGLRHKADELDDRLIHGKHTTRKSDSDKLDKSNINKMDTALGVKWKKNPLDRREIDPEISEVAPPGKKAEKMVKSIKAGYANDGKLTDKEKGIAYATVWKAHNAGKVEESSRRKVAEGINFAEMMRETDSGIAEMLSEIQADIDSFKKTGHASDKLEAFLKIHNHGKRLMGETVPKGPSFAPQDAMALSKPTKPFVPSRTQGTPSILDRAKDAVGSVASGINKVIGHGSDEELLADLRNKSTFEDAELNELARLAGLTENCEMTIGQGAMDMEQQQGKINVSTNASTDGNKNVTITADGDAADQLMSMLKMAGMSGGEAHARLASAEPEAIEIEMDEAEEQYANAPEECYQGQDVITHQGQDMNREKKQFAGMPKAGDNPMATPPLQALESMDPMDDMGRRLMREYQSLKLRK
jgi:hypothetical protein